MKLRIFQNSIRLRLNTNEVAGLARGQSIEMRIELFPEPLVCHLMCNNDNENATMTFANASLRIALPISQLSDWASSDRVGIAVTIGRINLLVEKDFKCLHGDVEDQEDCFTNPLATAE